MSRFKHLLLCAAIHLLSQPLTQAQKPVGVPAEPRDTRSDQRTSTNQPTTIAELNEEIRELKAQLDVLRRQNWVVTSHLICAPGFEAQEEDYAQARSRFQTKLIRKGPSPQKQPMPSPPAGVSIVEYTSGDLRLKGWLNRPSDQANKHPAVLYLHGDSLLAPVTGSSLNPTGTLALSS